MTTLNARANQAWHAEERGEFSVAELAAFEEGWETGYKTKAAEVVDALVLAADELDPPAAGWLELRDWFKDQLHQAAARTLEDPS